MQFSLDMYKQLEDMMSNYVGRENKVEIQRNPDMSISITLVDVDQDDYEVVGSIMEEDGY